jgi:hypothetical protein
MSRMTECVRCGGIESGAVATIDEVTRTQELRGATLSRSRAGEAPSPALSTAVFNPIIHRWRLEIGQSSSAPYPLLVGDSDRGQNCSMTSFRCRVRTWSAAGLAGALALSGLTVGTSNDAAALVAGTTLPGEMAAWGVETIVTSPSGRSQRHCTGSLVAPLWVLTAGHCTRSKTIVAVRIGASSTSPGTTIAVDRIVTAPGYDAAVGGWSSYQLDGALLRLTSPAPIQPVPLLERSSNEGLHDGATVRAVGWGSTTPFNPDIGQRGTSPVDAQIGNMIVSPFSGVLNRLLFLDASPAVVCFGDSGGPVIATLADGSSALAGVASAAPGYCTDRTNWDSGYTRVDTEWVRSITGGAAIIAGTPAYQPLRANSGLTVIAPVTISRGLDPNGTFIQPISLSGRAPIGASAALIEVDAQGPATAEVSVSPCIGLQQSYPSIPIRISTMSGAGSQMAVVPLDEPHQFCMASSPGVRINGVRLLGFWSPDSGFGLADSRRSVTFDGGVARRAAVTVLVSQGPGVQRAEFTVKAGAKPAQVQVVGCGRTTPLLTLRLRANESASRMLLLGAEQAWCLRSTQSITAQVSKIDRWAAGSPLVETMAPVEPWMNDVSLNSTVVGVARGVFEFSFGETRSLPMPPGASRALVSVSPNVFQPGASIAIGGCNQPQVLSVNSGSPQAVSWWIDLDSSGRLCTVSSGAGYARVQVVAVQ